MSPSGARLFLLITAALVFSPSFAHAFECHDHTTIGVPSNKPTLLCRDGYALSHSGKLKIPVWVQYHLTAEHAQGSEDRSNTFRSDPDLHPGERSELKDYKGSGYDRGHIAPAADMKWSEKAMDDSFLLSNMTPQVGIGFNRGIWAQLESLVRKWAIDRGDVYVISGPIFKKDSEHDGETIGPNKVAVPTHFFKIAYDPNLKTAIAFVLPNQALKTKDLPKYRVSVKAIEKDTGLDFLSALDTVEQDRIESEVVESPVKDMWPSGQD